MNKEPLLAPQWQHSTFPKGNLRKTSWKTILLYFLLFLLSCTSLYRRFFSFTEEYKTLVPFKYTELPPGHVKPLGWIKDQLLLEADGFAGHMYDFYYVVTNSTWLGGDFEYNELHEGAPYWYNGLVPLAYVLDDERLKGQVNHFLDLVLEGQQEDGWLGPETKTEERGFWARCLLLKGLVNHAIADEMKRERIVDAMHRFLDLSLQMLRNDFQGIIMREGDVFDKGEFGVYRAHEYAESLMWLYENHPRGKKEQIWETMELMWEAARVADTDWTTFFVQGKFPKGPEFTSSFEHGVNVAQALRYPSLLHRTTGQDSLIDQTRLATHLVLTHHLSPTGSIFADEGLAGRHPSRGTELCTSVELAFSLSYNYRLFGENSYADAAERVVLNAVPAGIAADWWSHQYVTQGNGAWARDLDSEGEGEEWESPFWNVGSRGLVFGQEPDYPCCAVNHPQGLPKFLMSALTRRTAGGLLHQYLVPLSARTVVDGENTTITVNTKYPFHHVITYSITSTGPYTFYVRIPSWAHDSSSYALINSAKVPIDKTSKTHDGLFPYQVPSGSSTFSIHLHTSPVVTTRTTRTSNLTSNETTPSSVSIYYGALLMALNLPFSISSSAPEFYRKGGAIPAPNTHPMSWDNEYLPLLSHPDEQPWAIAVDPFFSNSSPSSSILNVTDKTGTTINNSNDSDTPLSGMTVHHAKHLLDAYHPLPNPIFGPDADTVSISLPGVRVRNWGVAKGVLERPPQEVEVEGEVFEVRLVPVGGAKLHVGEFPVFSADGLGSGRGGDGA